MSDLISQRKQSQANELKKEMQDKFTQEIKNLTIKYEEDLLKKDETITTLNSEVMLLEEKLKQVTEDFQEQIE